MSPLDWPVAYLLFVGVFISVLLWLFAVATRAAERLNHPHELGLCEQCHRTPPRARLGLVEVGYAVRSICPDCARRAR